MTFDIIIGRTQEDKDKFGSQGAVFIGKQYIQMSESTTLSNPLYLDVIRSHVVFICGKRGSGKSYTMGTIAEGMIMLPEHIASNLACIMFDTMGVYWTMKYPNHKDEGLLHAWGLEGKGLPILLYTPTGYYATYKDKGVPTDFPFSINPAELAPSDWCKTFAIDPNSNVGSFIIRIVHELQEKQPKYTVQDIIAAIKQDTRAEHSVQDAAMNRFLNALTWGLFSSEGTLIKDLINPGHITVLDISAYASLPGAEGVRALVIGLVSQKLFNERMVARASEEYEAVHEAVHYFITEGPEKKEMPLVWLMVDEAHEFLPNDIITTATGPLVTILREGRQPGISLILATQQPGKIHTDVMTQSDIVIAHRLTAKVDVDALGLLMQSYMRSGLDRQINALPRTRGAAIVFDDINERLYPMQMRPRMTWHGGDAPSALREKKSLIEDI